MGAHKDDGSDSFKSTSQAQNHALKSLSNQEKLILVELQRTRSEIVNQLSRINPNVFKTTENWFEVKQTIESYKRKISDEYADNTDTSASSYFSSTAAPVRGQLSRKLFDSRRRSASVCHRVQTSSRSQSRRAQTSQRSVPKSISCSVKSYMDKLPPIPIMKADEIKTGIDMLPVMATSGNIALDLGHHRQEKLRLPVFKLPSLDLTSYHKSLNEGSIPYIKTENLTALTVAISIVRDSGKYKNRADFFKAIKIMRKLMRIDELAYMKKYLDINDKEIFNAEMDIQLYLFLNFDKSDEIEQDSGISDAVSEQKSNLVTVFSRACQIANLNSKSKDAFKSMTSTDIFENSINDEEFSTASDCRRNIGKSHYSKDPPIFDDKNDTKTLERFDVMKNDKKGSKRTVRGNYLMKGRLRTMPDIEADRHQSGTLKVDLMRSLSSMEHHSELVSE